MRWRAHVIGVCVIAGQTAAVIAYGLPLARKYIDRLPQSSGEATASASQRHETPLRPDLVLAASAFRTARDVTNSPCDDRPFVGVVIASSAVDVAPYNEGRVTAVHVRLGDYVRAGDLLVTLDSRIASAQREKALAEADVARAELSRLIVDQEEAKEKLSRAETLAAEGLASGAELTASRTQAKSATSRVLAARAHLSEMRAAARERKQVSEETRLRAPFAGEIAARFVDPGASVSRGAPLLRVVGEGDRFIRFAIPEACVERFRAGQQLAIDADSRGHGAATVARIAPEIDTSSRMVVVEAPLTAGSDGWPMGATVRVRP